MNSSGQLNLDFPGLTPSQESDYALQTLETPAIDTLHPEHQQRILDLANKVAQHRLRKGEKIDSSKSSSEMIRSLLQERKEECMSVLFLDAKHRVIAFEEMFHGTINGAMVYTRVLIKRALEHNSSAIILAHNHPSGTSEPSHADIQITQRIKDAMNLIEVKLLDHFVVSTEGITSLAERGLV